MTTAAAKKAARTRRKKAETRKINEQAMFRALLEAEKWFGILHVRLHYEAGGKDVSMAKLAAKCHDKEIWLRALIDQVRGL